MANGEWHADGQGGWILEADYALLDEKGRIVSGAASVEPATVGVYDADRCYTGAKIVEGKWDLSIHAFRDGKKYGAIPPSTTFSSLYDAQAEGAKRLAAQGKRYTKKYSAK